MSPYIKNKLKIYVVVKIGFAYLQEGLEDGGLENLDDLKLSASLHLKALQLSERPVEIEDGVALLQLFALLLRSRQDHGEVGSVDLEEDGVLLPHLVGQVLGVDELVVLVVGVLVLHHDVEHGPGVGDGHLGLLARLGRLDDVVLREGGGQDAPDPVRVELERPADLLDELAGALDDPGASVAHDAGHLHGVPARALAHDVAVEGVEDALVSQLQRVVEDLLVLGGLEPRGVPGLGRLRHLLLGNLAKTYQKLLVFI